MAKSQRPSVEVPGGLSCHYLHIKRWIFRGFVFEIMGANSLSSSLYASPITETCFGHDITSFRIADVTTSVASGRGKSRL